VIISLLWDTPMSRISFPAMLDDGAYAVTAYIPVKDRDVLLRLLRAAVESHFRLNVEMVEYPQRAYVLTVSQPHSSQLQPAKDGDVQSSGGGEGTIVGTAQTMDGVARALEDVLNAPVINETGLDGRYDYSAFGKLTEPESAFEMAHQLGLELTEAVRSIATLTVRKLQ
jgi:uncharacterized protein (TIGR03435 family)